MSRRSVACVRCYKTFYGSTHADIKIRLEGVNPRNIEQRLFDFCAIASPFYLNKSSSISPSAHVDGVYFKTLPPLSNRSC